MLLPVQMLGEAPDLDAAQRAMYLGLLKASTQRLQALLRQSIPEAQNHGFHLSGYSYCMCRHQRGVGYGTRRRCGGGVLAGCSRVRLHTARRHGALPLRMRRGRALYPFMCVL